MRLRYHRRDEIVHGKRFADLMEDHLRSENYHEMAQMVEAFLQRLHELNETVRVSFFCCVPMSSPAVGV